MNAGARWRAAVARLTGMSEPTTGLLLILMVAAGVVLRVQNVGYPFHYGWDENQYVGAAHQFMVGVRDTGECCHPPLSKLLIGVGMLLLGNIPAGWRFAPLCFGLQSIVLVFLIARSLFDDRRAGWLAAAFMAADGFYLSYSRAALPDVILACLVLWCMLAAITARGWRGVLACAVLVGIALSIKWVALLVVVPACFAILILRRAPWYALALFAVVPLVHLGIWKLGLGLIGAPHDVRSVWNAIQERQRLHLGFRHGANPAESAWYTWLVLYHPIVIKSANAGAKVRLASSVGNPVLWIAADLCLLALPVLGAAAALGGRWRERWRRWFDDRSTRALAILGVSWLSMMALWMTGRIITYWYHYLTPWGFAIMLVAGVVAAVDRRSPKLALLFVAVVLAVAIYFAPVWAELPISISAAHRRLIFPLWR
jgi:dolichyl-phosphate-mannose--protein O-mannosyl transferase